MTEGMLRLLGQESKQVLASQPFANWHFKRSVDADLPKLLISYVCERHGVEFACDGNEKIRTVFLDTAHAEQSLTTIPFSADREGIRNLFGAPSKSADRKHTSLMGPRGAWDRFDYEKHSIHVGYGLTDDRVSMITFMRADVVP